MYHQFRPFVVAACVAAIASPAIAGNFPYNRNVTLKVGQSIILKGVRNNCEARSQPWSHIAPRLPQSKLGSFSDGGPGTVRSNSCGKVVGARGVKFTARKQGKERFVIYDDAISVTVK